MNQIESNRIKGFDELDWLTPSIRVGFIFSIRFLQNCNLGARTTLTFLNCDHKLMSEVDEDSYVEYVILYYYLEGLI